MKHITQKTRDYLAKVGRVGGLVAGGETDVDKPKRIPEDFRAFAAKVGSIGGAAVTTPKIQAARNNGKKGGRPRLKDPNYYAIKQRESRARRAKKKK